VHFFMFYEIGTGSHSKYLYNSHLLLLSADLTYVMHCPFVERHHLQNTVVVCEMFTPRMPYIKSLLLHV